MSRLKNIFTAKIPNIYLYLGILIVLVVINFLVFFEKFIPTKPPRNSTAQKISEKIASLQMADKNKKIEKLPDDPYVFARYFARDYPFIAINKMIQLPSGNFYVMDRNDAKLLKFNLDGKIIKQWEFGNSHSDLLNDFTIDRDLNIYVVISQPYKLPEIRKYNYDGVFIRSWNTYKSEDAYRGMSNLNISSIAVDSKNNLYADDSKAQCILKFDSEGNLIKKWGSAGAGQGQFNFSRSSMTGNRIVVDDLDNIYVIDRLNNRIQKFDSEGNFILTFGRHGRGNGEFRNPAGITIGPDKNVYVADEGNRRIQIFAPDGKWLGKWGKHGTGDGFFSLPYYIMFDQQGMAYVLDQRKIQVFAPAWNRHITTRTPSVVAVSFEKEYKYYTMESDNRVSSRTITHEKIKLNLLEELGTYLEGKDEIKKMGLTKKQLSVLASGIVNITILDEAWTGNEYYIRAKIVVPEQITNLVSSIWTDHEKTSLIEAIRRKALKTLQEIEKQRETITSSKVITNSQKINAYNNNIQVLILTNLLEKGYSLLISRKLNEALEIYNKAIKLNPQDAIAYTLRGSAYSSLGEHQKAIRDLTRASQLEPQNPIPYRFMGDINNKLANYSRAIKHYDIAIELEPTSAKLYGNRGISYAAIGNNPRAMQDFDRAIELGLNNYEIYNNRGIALYGLGRYSEAIEDFEKSITLNPKLKSAYFFQGNAFSHLGDFRQAVKLFDTVIKLDPKFTEAYNMRGISNNKIGNYKQAIKDFNKLITIDPESSNAYTNRGLALQMLGKLKEAIRDYNKAIEISPKNAQSYNNRGVFFKSTNKFQKALMDFSIAVALDPELIESYNNRGDTYFSLGDYNHAINDYNKMIDLNPRHARAYSKLGTSYLYLGDTIKAVKNLNRAIEVDPKLPDPYNNLGNVYNYLGDYSQAVNYFDKAIELKHSNIYGVYYNRGRAYYYQGLFEKASKDFRNSLRNDYHRIHLLLALNKISKEEYYISLHEFRKYVMYNKSSGWIRLISKYYLGMDGVTEATILLKARNVDNEKEKNERLCEAYYYLGERRLMKGDRKGAEEFFNKSIETNTINSLEYTSSKAMLSLMKGEPNSRDKQTITYYYNRLLTADDIRDRSLRELSIMRNTIFARAGNVFHKKWLNEYFENQDWYKATGLDHSKLTKLDYENAMIIAKREATISKEELLRRRDLLRKFKEAGKWNSGFDIELGMISSALGEAVNWDPSAKKRSPLEDHRLLDKLITVKHLENLSSRDLRIVRNMIFARHGRPFKSKILQKYFDRMSWYKIDHNYTDDRLTEIDKKNIKIVLSVEQSHGGPITESQHSAKKQEEIEKQHWFGGA